MIFRVNSTASRQSSSLVTSSLIKDASPPPSRICAATAFPSGSSMSAITTFAPSFTNNSASVAPCPLEPPEISATLPSSLMLSLQVSYDALIVASCRFLASH